MSRTLAVVLTLVVSAEAAAQQSRADIRAHGIADLGEYFQNARIVTSRPSFQITGVELFGPIRLFGGPRPLCVVDSLTVHYEPGDVISFSPSHDVRGVSVEVLRRLPMETWSESPGPSGGYLSECEANPPHGGAQWFIARYERSDWGLVHVAAWLAADLLQALRSGEPNLGALDLRAFARHEGDADIASLRQFRATNLSSIVIEPCPAPSETCRQAVVQIARPRQIATLSLRIDNRQLSGAEVQMSVPIDP